MNWQKKVCRKLQGGGLIPENRMEEFWNRGGGMNAARDALKTRRTSVTNAVNKKFKGERKGGEAKGFVLDLCWGVGIFAVPYPLLSLHGCATPSFVERFGR